MIAVSQRRVDIARQMAQALDELGTAPESTVLVMFWAGFAHSEICTATDESLRRVTKRLAAALQKVKGLL